MSSFLLLVCCSVIVTIAPSDGRPQPQYFPYGYNPYEVYQQQYPQRYQQQYQAQYQAQYPRYDSKMQYSSYPVQAPVIDIDFQGNPLDLNWTNNPNWNQLQVKSNQSEVAPSNAPKDTPNPWNNIIVTQNGSSTHETITSKPMITSFVQSKPIVTRIHRVFTGNDKQPIMKIFYNGKDVTDEKEINVDPSNRLGWTSPKSTTTTTTTVPSALEPEVENNMSEEDTEEDDNPAPVRSWLF